MTGQPVAASVAPSTTLPIAEQVSVQPLRLDLPEALELGVRAGGLGGGTGSDCGSFSEEGELSASLGWRLRNLALGEAAVREGQESRARRARIELQMMRDAVAEQVTVSFFRVREGCRQVELAQSNVQESLRSLELNMRRIRCAEGLPIEALQAIQACATAREDYLESIGEFNRAQFQLLHAVGSEVLPRGSEER